VVFGEAASVLQTQPGLTNWARGTAYFVGYGSGKRVYSIGVMGTVGVAKTWDIFVSGFTIAFIMGQRCAAGRIGPQHGLYWTMPIRHE
jgi:hypothetical protein